MNKKFMIVALMAALSTVGYAYTPVETSKQEINGTITDWKNDKFKGEVNLPNVDTINKNFENLENLVNDNRAAFDYAKAESELKDKEHDKAIADLDKNKADKDYVDGKVTELGDHVREEMDTVRGEIGGVKAEVYENKEAIAANKTQIDKNTAAIENHEDRLTGLENNFAQYDGRLSGLEKKVDHLDDKMNKGLSLMAAMNAVDFQNVQTGEMALGAGIGHYGNAQSVALGVAYSPVEDLTVNAKYSVTAGDVDSFALGAGATYKFKIGR